MLVPRSTVNEPARGATDGGRAVVNALPFWDFARYMWRPSATRHVVIGNSLAGFVGYGMTLWLPAFAIYLIPAFFGVLLAFFWRVLPGANFAMVQGLVQPEMRAVATAFCLFQLNIIGLGFGPQGVGIVSDLLSDQFGHESPRYSLMRFYLVNIWSAFHYFMATETLRKGMANTVATA